MIPIKHILYENGVEEIFKFIVPSGNFQGEYVIEKPTGWDDVDSIIDIDEELFNVKNFIIGENTKLKFYQYSNKEAFDILYKVYEEQQVDGRIIFKWIAKKENFEYDLLKDNMEVNLNKYNKSLDNSMSVIEVEIVKSEAQNKLFNREDTTIDLFAEKDLDENPINPIQTFTVGYKKGDRKLSNFYYFDVNQLSLIDIYKTEHFFSFVRADEYQFGNNTNQYCGRKLHAGGLIIDQGPFVTTDVTLKFLKVEISNFHVYGFRDDKQYVEIKLYAIIRGPGQNYVQELLKSDKIPDGAGFASELKIDNKIFDLINPSNLAPGQSLSFIISSNSTDEFKLISIKTNTSIEITTNQESPLVKTQGVRLIDAIDQVTKNYTSSKLNVVSSYIGEGGVFYNTSISTGVYLRGLPPVYTVGQKMKTSFKSLVTDGCSKLLALGYDILGNHVIIEDIGYFFKDKSIYDLSDKEYINEGFKINSDKDVTFNQLIFGSKKFSKNVKDDIRNFVTSAEFSTPIVSIKNKLDKQTEVIVDEYKIQELIEDGSSSTNDNDDDLVLIDMVNKTNYWDLGVFDNCIHSIKNGKLTLTSTLVPFDTTMMKVGSMINIIEGINSGTYTILEINGIDMTVDKSAGIQEGFSDTPISYLINSLTKNRSLNDGFIDYSHIRDAETTTNARHNPKYQMARWFPFFGSGLVKKKDSDIIKVTNYKNNDEAKMTAISNDLHNELQGEIIVGSNENLGRLRAYKQPFFSGDIIEISIAYVTFEEFIMFYENWKYGLSGDRMENRGYVVVNTPIGLLDVYPFGSGAFSHDRKNNVLSIKGKIKGKSVKNPVLISVNQISEDTVKMIWDYSQDYINPKINLQYSLDGNNWLTLIQIENSKESNLTSSLFDDINSGTTVYFRIIVFSNDIINKESNIITVEWTI